MWPAPRQARPSREAHPRSDQGSPPNRDVRLYSSDPRSRAGGPTRPPFARSQALAWCRRDGDKSRRTHYTSHFRCGGWRDRSRSETPVLRPPFRRARDAADSLDAHAFDVAQSGGEVEHDRVHGILRRIEIALGEHGLGLGDAPLPGGETRSTSAMMRPAPRLPVSRLRRRMAIRRLSVTKVCMSAVGNGASCGRVAIQCSACSSAGDRRRSPCGCPALAQRRADSPYSVWRRIQSMSVCSASASRATVSLRIWSGRRRR